MSERGMGYGHTYNDYGRDALCYCKPGVYSPSASCPRHGRTPADHSIADEMLEELRRENERYRDALVRITFAYFNGGGEAAPEMHDEAVRALNPTEVDG